MMDIYSRNAISTMGVYDRTSPIFTGTSAKSQNALESGDSSYKNIRQEVTPDGTGKHKYIWHEMWVDLRLPSSIPSRTGRDNPGYIVSTDIQSLTRDLHKIISPWQGEHKGVSIQECITKFTRLLQSR